MQELCNKDGLSSDKPHESQGEVLCSGDNQIEYDLENILNDLNQENALDEGCCLAMGDEDSVGVLDALMQPAAEPYASVGKVHAEHERERQA